MKTLFLSFAFLVAACSAQAESEKWELVDSFGGLTIYRMEIPGNPVLKFKGDGIIDAPMGKLLTVVLDTPSKPQWMNRVKEAEVVAVENAHSRVEYMRMKTPWPLKDRDALYRVSTEANPAEHSVTVKFASVEDSRKPVNDCCVRAEVFPSQFKLIALPDGKTRVEAEAHTDPKGAIPKFIVNMVQKKFPRQSYDGMIKRALSPGIADHPLAIAATARPPSPEKH